MSSCKGVAKARYASIKFEMIKGTVTTCQSCDICHLLLRLVVLKAKHIDQQPVKSGRDQFVTFYIMIGNAVIYDSLRSTKCHYSIQQNVGPLDLPTVRISCLRREGGGSARRREGGRRGGGRRLTHFRT